MHVLDWIRLSIYVIRDTFGMVANAILVFLVLKRTPKHLATYSILILNFAVCDFIACFASLVIQQRVISDGFALYFISYGPCKFIGSLACFVGYSIMLHCYSHSLWSLLFSFSYRYYIIGHEQPKSSTIIIIIFLIYLPSFCQLIVFSFATDPEDELKAEIQKKFGYDVSSGSVSGHLNIMRWNVLPFVLHIALPVAPVYIVILILRKLTASRLYVETAINDNSRRLQSQLLKALTVQASLPILFLFGVMSYATEQLNIYHHPLLEYIPAIMLGFTPALTPLTAIYFIHPYRRWIQKKFSRQNKAVPVLARSRTTVTNRLD